MDQDGPTRNSQIVINLTHIFPNGDFLSFR